MDLLTPVARSILFIFTSSFSSVIYCDPHIFYSDLFSPTIVTAIAKKKAKDTALIICPNNGRFNGSSYG